MKSVFRRVFRAPRKARILSVELFEVERLGRNHSKALRWMMTLKFPGGRIEKLATDAVTAHCLIHWTKSKMKPNGNAEVVRLPKGLTFHEAWVQVIRKRKHKYDFRGMKYNAKTGIARLT